MATKHVRYRQRLRERIEAMPKIPCACGCGELIAPISTNGQARKFVLGHQSDGSQLPHDHWLGRKHSAESLAKMSAAHDRGSTNYWGLHKWVQRHLPKAGVCEHCGQTTRTHWANRDHQYRSRAREEWLELCGRCHILFDIEYNDKRHGAASKVVV